MPGLSLRQADDADEGAVDAALESVLFFEDYRSEELYAGDRTTVASTGYDGYPVRTVETETGMVAFEGELYGEDDVAGQLRDVGEHLLAGRTDPVEAWMLSRDGDFLLTAVDAATGTARILTDPLGRLPVYVATVGDATVVSRELKFVREYAEAVGDPLGIDRLGVAQTLQFGYRLGTRTLFEGVERLPPAAVATVDDGVRVERLHRHDYGHTPHGSNDVATNVDALVDLFRDACQRRAMVREETVVALSGGLDSRAVAAGFADAGPSFRSATFDRPDGGNGDEVAAAREVADVLDVPWESTVAAASDRQRRRLLDTKQGMNYLRLAFMLDFLESIDGERGATTLVTGDGGDKTLPSLTPPRDLNGEDDVVDFVLSDNRIFDTGEAARIAGVEEQRLVDSVRKRIQSYPETDDEALYVHFLVRERGMNWLFQGEDRNRYYYWSVSPFYAWPFFQYAMGIPAAQKSGERIQERFLDELAPELLDVEYVNFGAPVTSAEYRVKRAAYDALSRYPGVRDSAVTVLKRVKGDSTVASSGSASDLRREVAEDDRIDRVLPGASTDGGVADLESYSTPALYHLLTLTRLFGDSIPRESVRAGGASQSYSGP